VLSVLIKVVAPITCISPFARAGFKMLAAFMAQPKIIEELEENRPVEFPDIIRNTNPGEKKSVSIQ